MTIKLFRRHAKTPIEQASEAVKAASAAVDKALESLLHVSNGLGDPEFQAEETAQKILAAGNDAEKIEIFKAFAADGEKRSKIEKAVDMAIDAAETSRNLVELLQGLA